MVSDRVVAVVTGVADACPATAVVELPVSLTLAAASGLGVPVEAAGAGEQEISAGRATMATSIKSTNEPKDLTGDIAAPPRYIIET